MTTTTMMKMASETTMQLFFGKDSVLKKGGIAYLIKIRTINWSLLIKISQTSRGSRLHHARRFASKTTINVGLVGFTLIPSWDR